MAERLSNEELIDRLAKRGDFGAFTWEIDPDNTRSTAQRLRRMADDPFFPVHRVADDLYPNATKFAVRLLKVEIRSGGEKP